MGNNSSSRTLKDIVNDLKLTVQGNSTNVQKSQDLITELDNEISNIQMSKRLLGRTTIIAIVIIAFGLWGLTLLYDRNEALNSKIESLEYRDSLFKTFMEPDSTSYITYRIKNGKPVTYRQLSHESDSLQNKYNDIVQLKEHYRIQLGLITRNYPILLKKEGDVYSVYAPKLDSALYLLPVYRDKIRFDKRTNSWIVTRENK